MEEYYLEETEEQEDLDDGPMFVESRYGTTLLQYKGQRYTKRYQTKRGARWGCSRNKRCSAYLLLNHDDEIILANTIHSHDVSMEDGTVDLDQDDTAVLITSRKGKEILLFREYTYRRQYQKHNRSRWVCSNLKNCRACVFTDDKNYITSVMQEHCHEPPKYYRNPSNVIDALRESVVTEKAE